jgi:hypothetical protein
MPALAIDAESPQTKKRSGMGEDLQQKRDGRSKKTHLKWRLLAGPPSSKKALSI